MDGSGSSNNPHVVLIQTEYGIYQKAFVMVNIMHGGVNPPILVHFGLTCR